MPETSIEPFRPEHLTRLCPRPAARANMAWSGDFAALARAYAANGPALTLRLDGAIAACGGICLCWPGMGEAWCVTSPLVERHPIRFCKEARKALALLERATRAHRVQAHAEAADPRAGRWLAWLGFGNEGLCEAYGPHRENVYRYARIHACNQSHPQP
ncbi:MAG: hypothetical protein AB7E47_08720 [Desulfovibrionaceae bacterium]